MKHTGLAIAFALLAGASPGPGAFAQSVASGKPVPGYDCMSLALTHEQAVDRSFSVPVFERPSLSSPQVGVAPGIVYVKVPTNIQAGFQEMLFANGHSAWIAKTWLQPLSSANHPKAHCTLLQQPNGRIVFTIVNE